MRLWAHTQKSSPRTKFHQVSPQIMISLSFIAFRHMPYVKHRLPHFVRHPPTRLSLNSALIPLVGKPYQPITQYWYDIVYFGTKALMILFSDSSQKVSYQFDVVHIYQLIILHISTRCGTYVISTLKLIGWPTNLVFSQLKEYPISLNCYKIFTLDGVGKL